jgi:C4-dicarboxylate-specific signal transduction histidine kinase
MNDTAAHPGPSAEQWMELGRLAEFGLAAATLVHELRQPLFALKAILQIQQGERSGVRDLAMNKLAMEQVLQLEALLESAGGLAPRPGSWDQPFHVGETVRAVHAALAPRVRKLGVRFDLDVHDPLPVLRGNPVAMRQVISNLVQNGVDAVGGRPDPRVVLSARSAAEEVTITLADNGVGIGPEQRARIFEPFFTTKPPGKGTGLGLSIAQNLVQLAGGRVEIASVPGATQVEVHLPCARPTG